MSRHGSCDASLPVPAAHSAGRRQRRVAQLACALALGAGAALVSVSAAAQAAPQAAAPQTAADKTLIARDLFERGKARWAAGQYEEAAALLAASNQQAPKAGTSMLLGDAYEHLGRLRTARDTFRLASQLAHDSGESQLEYRASTREAALLPRLPQVEIRVTEPLPPGLSISLNGRELPPSELNVATALDAGTYVLEARAPGREPFSARLTLTNDAPQQLGVRVVSVQLPPLGQAAAPGAGRETLAWWLGGAGSVLLVASAVSLIVALDQSSSSEDECGLAAGAAVDDKNACTAHGVELRNQARTWANLATIGGVLGVAGLGAGLTLHFTAHDVAAGSGAWVGYRAAF